MATVSAGAKRTTELARAPLLRASWCITGDGFVMEAFWRVLWGRIRSRTRGQLRGIRFEVERHARDEHFSAQLERTSSLRPFHEVLALHQLP